MPNTFANTRDLGLDDHTVRGAPTSITAFIGRALSGPLDTAVQVRDFGEFTTVFGGLWDESPMTYALHQFFLNGGGEAVIVRVHHESAPDARDRAWVDLPTEGGGAMRIEASNPGTRGRRLRVSVEHPVAVRNGLFHLTVQETDGNTPPGVIRQERLPRLSADPTSSRFVTHVLQERSALVRVLGSPPVTLPVEASYVPLTGGHDGSAIGDLDVIGQGFEEQRRGLYALEDTDLFNLLCIPPFSDDVDVSIDTWDAAVAYCTRRRAVVLVDPPGSWRTPEDAAISLPSVVTRSPNAALYYPWLRSTDPLRGNRLRDRAPSGAVAGVIARTDATRGVWKAPAGQPATLVGAPELTVPLTDTQNAMLNRQGINCLRMQPGMGRVIWGARTLAGNDDPVDRWAFLPVRRTALFIEESLLRGLHWVAFEPNDERLWAEIRQTCGAFMHGLFRQGAFQGATPQQAYFVRCDAATNPQSTIDQGIVEVVVGFAPLKPADFVVLRIRRSVRTET
ncbi:hypothetical protein SAMN02745244_02865 [Tessaracoccus bendigoensis DSM 12906]|uniref:Tail sheath protein C-terminal domain-containing protein n=1 Tax=Tessaracoccus bendigoensis DSM 12906 TaxID=1123357 RepID=A0A1M6KMZ3_9ACTN|nr:phage tail sheath subtilisin-like domain-containing protein [Tessaracoccus bendigoensis]SHJ60287.1 hypothetical protein SAMN02745244_02865 [Tessaracoccus bendigoensis DSM 12906]